LHNVMRSAEPVGDVSVGAIAERMVYGGDKIRDVDRVVGRRASLRVAAAHDLPATHAAAGDRREKTLRGRRIFSRTALTSGTEVRAGDDFLPARPVVLRLIIVPRFPSASCDRRAASLLIPIMPATCTFGDLLSSCNEPDYAAPQSLDFPRNHPVGRTGLIFVF
jgi:hypothetical protein